MCSADPQEASGTFRSPVVLGGLSSRLRTIHSVRGSKNSCNDLISYGLCHFHLCISGVIYESLFHLPQSAADLVLLNTFFTVERNGESQQD